VNFEEELEGLNKNMEVLKNQLTYLSLIRDVVSKLIILQELQEKSNEKFELIYQEQIKINYENLNNLKNITDNLTLLNHKVDTMGILFFKK
jgi:hypothetical protein